MKTSSAQYTKNILLVLYLLQCNTLFTSEKFLAHHNKAANSFIQKLPRMTLSEAGNELHNLQPLTQRMVWHKVGQNSFQNKNDILSTTLLLTTVPLEIQYLIFTEDCGAHKTKKLAPEEKGKISIIDVPDVARKKLTNSSIYELFRWKAVIDKKCRKKNFVKIVLTKKWHGAIECPEIVLTKPELFSLTIDHIDLIKKTQTEILKKQQLRLLAELPDSLLEKLKHYYHFDNGDGHHGYNNRQIKFHYYEIPTLKSAIMQVLEPLVFILPPLLCTYFYIKPAWDTITGTQDPLALEKNMKKELYNKAVELLQKNCAEGSEYLNAKTIRPVPFSYSWSDSFEYFKPMVPMSVIDGLLIAHYFISSTNNAPPTHKGFVPAKSSRMWRTISALLKRDSFYFVMGITISSILGPICSLCTTQLAYDFTTNYIKELNDLFSISIALASSIFIAINMFNLIIKPHWRCIDFSKKKFENKSVKEYINYYLNHPRIVIPN